MTIPSGESFVEFPITAVDDDLLDGSQFVHVSASATGYVSGTAAMTVTDWETVTLEFTPATISEKSGSASATITRNNIDINAAIVFTLSSSDTSEALVPASVIIPAGQASATFVVQGVDDGLLDGDQTVSITASQTGYQTSQATLVVSDWEELSLSLFPSAVSEITVRLLRG